MLTYPVRRRLCLKLAQSNRRSGKKTRMSETVGGVVVTGFDDDRSRQNICKVYQDSWLSAALGKFQGANQVSGGETFHVAGDHFSWRQDTITCFRRVQILGNGS
jgi:hypothetical protein